MGLIMRFKWDPPYAHFSILGAQERNCRLDEGPETSREIGGTLRKGTELKERASKSKEDARAWRCLEAQEKILGVRILRVLWNMTESKQKLGSPGDQNLGSFGKRPWSRSQISCERSGSPRFLDIDFTSFNFTEFIYQFFFFFFLVVFYIMPYHLQGGTVLLLFQLLTFYYFFLLNCSG